MLRTRSTNGHGYRFREPAYLSPRARRRDWLLTGLLTVGVMLSALLALALGLFLTYVSVQLVLAIVRAVRDVSAS